MDNHFGGYLSVFPKVQKFPTCVGCINYIATNGLDTLGHHTKIFFLFT